MTSSFLGSGILDCLDTADRPATRDCEQIVLCLGWTYAERHCSQFIERHIMPLSMASDVDVMFDHFSSVVVDIMDFAE